MKFTLAVLAVISLAAPWACAEDFLFDEDTPVVITPTRLKQTIHDTPASVTVITKEQLEKYGIQSIAEAMRLVPGMSVSKASGNRYRISYHGGNILVPRRMNVQIDGMSIYRPAIAQVEWSELPVNINDVARIEVTRGPNSAAYGANSMMAIVNIITVNPADISGTTINSTVGSLNTVNGFVRYGSSIGDTSFQISMSSDSNDGYDKHMPGTRAVSEDDNHDGQEIKKIYARSSTAFNNSTLDINAGYTFGEHNYEYVESAQQTLPDVDIEDYFLNAKWNIQLADNHDLMVKSYYIKDKREQDWLTCLPTAMLLPEMAEMYNANPAYAAALLAGQMPSGGTAEDDTLAMAALTAYMGLGARGAVPTCGTTNQSYSESQADIEIQDTYVFSDSLRVVSGLGFRSIYADSETYFGGTRSQYSSRIFANVEYKPLDYLNINLGGFLENEEVTGSEFSPRLAANLHINKNQTLRFIVSRAVRTPDVWEQDVNWRYRVSGYTPDLNGETSGYYYASANAAGDLHSEEIISREIGYYGGFLRNRLQIDVRLFKDSMTELISEKTQLTDFNPTNDNSTDMQGAELQLSYNPFDKFSTRFAYAYLDSETTTWTEKTQYARHSGSFNVAYDFADDLSMAFSYYGSESIGATYYGREDLVLTKAWGDEFKTSIIAKHYDNNANSIQRDTNSFTGDMYKDSMHYYISLTLNL